MIKPSPFTSAPVTTHNPATKKRAQFRIIAVISALLFAALIGYAYVRTGNPATPINFIYIPILIAASLFEMRGALTVAILASLFTGPLVPRQLSGTSWQIDEHWVLQSGFFILFAITISAIIKLFQSRIVHAEYETLKAEQQVDRLSEMYTKILTSLANTVEVRDRHTQGHCERVAENALVLGKAMQLNDSELEILHWSAMLHDLGKIAVPEYILLKESKLTEREYEEIKKHPVYGAELLASVSPEFNEIATVVKAHHERWDGKGYPQQLSQHDIPKMSRIISIVDVFEALTSLRPYRQPMPPSQALEYVVSGAGSQFDPELVRVFEACYMRGEIRFSAASFGGAFATVNAAPSVQSLTLSQV